MELLKLVTTVAMSTQSIHSLQLSLVSCCSQSWACGNKAIGAEGPELSFDEIGAEPSKWISLKVFVANSGETFPLRLQSDDCCGESCIQKCLKHLPTPSLCPFQSKWLGPTHSITAESSSMVKPHTQITHKGSF